MAARIRKGDQVMVTTGRSRGVRGEVLSVAPKTGKAVVRGANVVKRHSKPDRFGQGGGIIEKEMPIDLSNLALIDPKTDKVTKVSFRILEGGRKVRVARKSGEVIG
ncbi:50S ribosomal protein L24 [Formicincola oecophyllae]|uniref:Large ribosomal subunit protein uL24 n=1 Tax=Formicincola oecophyllae TaxID=2558361 RepID=A0A4Y6U9B6_9PROT|nr:50S ribosomal protein L24 [Formicincola oecophyllae]QDH13148.1 50S ribosomal protein L24 [Formicincola oecophyllae]